MSGEHTQGTAPSFTGHGRAEITTADELISVERYLAPILADVHALAAMHVGLPDALGLVLAEDLHATESLPAFPNSAMDGYAVRSADLGAATVSTPVPLHVVGEVAAGGSATATVDTGQAVRIMTGAPLPPGADAVVPVEVTSAIAGGVQVHRPSRQGEFVRTVGQDVRAGDLLVASGRRLRPADIGLLAANGVTRLSVYPAPRVVILSTGDELVPPDQTPGPGRIRNSNGPMLVALVRQLGAQPFWSGIVPDERAALHNAFDSNLGHADMFITTGGVSAGTHDLVREVVGQLGDVWSVKVAMQPGMPQAYGRIQGVPVFCLPGNPVSAFVSFETFVRPAIRTMQARPDLHRPTVSAELTADVTSPRDKRSFLRVTLQRGEGRWMATPTGHQGSHVMTSITTADGLAEIPEGREQARAGERVRVRLLVDS